MNIEHAVEQELGAINDIYNYYVETSYATFETSCWTLQLRKEWFIDFKKHHEKYNLLVAKVDSELVGFAYNAKYKEKPAYQTSSEVTVYVRPGYERRGIAFELYKVLLAAIKTTTLHRLYAVIALPNEASIRLHEKFAFKEVGRLHEVGYKHGKFHSTAILEKKL